MKNLRSNNLGFTLVEMLVAVSVSSIILLMIYTAYSSILKTVNYGAAVSSYYEKLNLALRKIDRDISNIYWREDGKAGFLCTEKNNSTLLTFVTYDYKNNRIINNLKDGYPVYDIYRVSYYLKPNDSGKHFSLIRNIESGFEVDVSETDVSEGGVEEILLDNVIEYNVSLSLRNDWTNKWDTRENRHLPKGIKSLFMLENISGIQEKYEILTVPDIANE